MCLIALVAAAALLAGTSNNDVVFSNLTGLPIARLYVGERVLQSEGGLSNGPILVAVTPTKHTLRIVFRGGATVVWTHLDFKGVHAITFFRQQNKIEARVE